MAGFSWWVVLAICGLGSLALQSNRVPDLTLVLNNATSPEVQKIAIPGVDLRVDRARESTDGPESFVRDRLPWLVPLGCVLLLVLSATLFTAFRDTARLLKTKRHYAFRKDAPQLEGGSDEPATKGVVDYVFAEGAKLRGGANQYENVGPGVQPSAATNPYATICTLMCVILFQLTCGLALTILSMEMGNSCNRSHSAVIFAAGLSLMAFSGFSCFGFWSTLSDDQAELCPWITLAGSATATIFVGLVVSVISFMENSCSVAPGVQATGIIVLVLGIVSSFVVARMPKVLIV
ncbi:hypothetical protein AAMO2058_001431100 [Amorphochlora amoebiformis]